MSTHLFLAAPPEGGDRRDAERWSSSLGAEWRLRSEGPGLRGPVRSIFVEAGSAPLLGATLARRVREIVGPSVLRSVREWTVEIETPTLHADWLDAWAEAGVSRLSLRGAAATEDAVRRLARDLAGGRHRLAMGVEVELGGGEEGAARTRRGIHAAIRAGATSVALTEPGSSLAEPPHEEGEVAAGTPPGPEGVRSVSGDGATDPRAWRSAMRAFDEAGWEVPELSFAHRPGHPPLYALALARRSPVFGLGPGAISFHHPVREWNPSAWGSYLASVPGGAGLSTPRRPAGPTPAWSLRSGCDGEVLTRAEGRLERIWMALRTERGLRLPESLTPGGRGVGAGRPAHPDPARGDEAWAGWHRRGWIRAPSSGVYRRLRLTRTGWLHADQLAVEIAALLEA